MIPFSPPRIDEKNIEAVAEVLRSGWLTTGPKTKLFEKEITSYIGCSSTICLASATAGLELMLRWFGLKEGDEVIVPTYTYSSTGNVVLHCGAKIVFAEAGPDFNVSPESIRSLITERTKAIMSVDLGGFPVDYDEIKSIINDPEIRFLFRPETENQEKLGRIFYLADSAHAFGARYKDEMVGCQADAHCFSFHAVKNLSTAEGGAVCMNLPEPFSNDDLYRSLNISSLHGQTKDALAKMQKGNWRYDIVEPGYKCNMTDIQAALGLVELARYEDETLKRRREIMEMYHDLLKVNTWAELPSIESEIKTSSFHLYMLRIKGISEEQRDQIIQGIFDRDVSVNVHFQPLPLFTAYKERGYDMKSTPEALDLYKREISLPIFYDLSDEQIQTVCQAVVASVESVLN